MDDIVAYRKALSNFATGVTVASTVYCDDIVSITVNSFTSVSLEPRLILVCIGKNAAFLPAVTDSQCFSVCILPDSCIDIAQSCSTLPIKERAQFFHINSDSPFPETKNFISKFECTVYSIYEAGDHYVIIGRVKSFRVHEHKSNPLLYFKSQLLQYNIDNDK
mgnify:CR=1 FL=1